MSEEIRYEAVFGDQGLFDGADEDVVLAETNGVYITFHKESDKPYPVASISRADLAMRRIIRTPTWTVADQKAGKLPEVGCVVMVSPNCTATVTAIDNIQKVVAVQCENQALDILAIHEMLPIETPEENAARLREEWCVHALKLINKNMSDSCDAVVIYDALLSGELQAPKGE